MSYVFELPEVGEGVTEAELVKWSVAVGEVIAPDQVVCEVMTDKATMEINCPVGGTVVEVCGEEGDILPVHAALLKLSQDVLKEQEHTTEVYNCFIAIQDFYKNVQRYRFWPKITRPFLRLVLHGIGTRRIPKIKRLLNKLDN